MKLLRKLTNNADGASSWQVLLLIFLAVSLPFGLGIVLTSWGAPAVSVQVQVPGAPDPNQPTGQVALKMIQPRWGHSATPLGDGRILITGGYQTGPAADGTAAPADIDEVFDPATGTFSQYTGQLPTQSLGPTPAEAASILLQNDWTLSFDLNNVNLPWPDLDFAGTNNVPVPPDANLSSLERGYATASQLNTISIYQSGQADLYSYNRVLVVGGINNAGEVQDSAVFNPARLATDKNDYFPGEVVWLVGAGWKTNELVDVWVVDDRGWEYKTTVTADDTGKFPTAEPLFNVIDEHLGVTFDLTAIGADSGFVSTVRFTDANAPLTAISAGLQSGTLNYGTAASATFAMTATLGSGSKPPVTYTVTSGLPPGATAPPVTGSGGNPQNATMTISTSTTTLPGSYTITFSGTDGLTPRTTTGTLTVLQRSVTITGVTAAGKVYDGTTTATLSGGSVSSVVNGDIVTVVVGSGTFASKNVGSQAVTATGYSLGGADVSKYLLSAQPAVASATISARPMAVTAAGVNKVYNGTTAATVTLSDNRVSGDVLTTSFTTATFADKNVGTGKTVSVSGISLSGTDSGNYTFNTTASTTANLTAKGLTVSATGVNKVYDGTTVATVTLADNRVSGDAITDSFTSAGFADKNVGTGKTVSVSGISITGADAGNYSLGNTTATTSANITALAITGSITAANKVYDQTTTAAITSRTLTGAIGGDTVSYNGGTATFANKNVGTAKTVTGTGLSLSGADAGNYTVNTSATTTADITARSLTVSASGVNRVYDGTVTATVTLSDNRVSGDLLTTSFTAATFSDKNVGTGKTVSVSGISITGGADAANYSLANTTANTTANITAKSLTVSATGVNKVYDGTTAATVNLSDNRVSGDVFTDSYTSASFANKTVANGKTVSVSGVSISGADAGNYTFNTTASTTANITALAITGSITAADKIYDRTTAATITSRTLTGAIGGDTVSYTGGTATFADRNVGTGKTVTGAGLSLGGADAGNYTVNSTATTTANITALAITGHITAANRIYDGTTAATILTRTLTGVIAGDTVSYAGGKATFADEIVANGKTVTGTGLGLTGADAANYSVNSTATTTANITALALTGSITAANKVYDGTTAATILTRTLTGVIAGDTVSYTGGTATFANTTVGTGKTVTATGLGLSGSDAVNYTVNGTATTTANITALPLTGSITAANKVYDGTTTATITSRTLTGVIAGDTVNYTGTTATFDTKDVGTGKTVTATGMSLGGGDKSNYTVNSTATTTADITALAITGNFTASNKTYDGNNSAGVLTRTLNGVIGVDVVSLTGGTATFDTKDVGTGKTVTLAGATLSGAQAGNYSLTSVGTTTANITVLGITGNFTASSKTYDGGASAAVLTRTLNGVIGGDIVSLIGGTATFDTKDVGTGKTVTLAGATLSGAQAGNYSLTGVGTTAADITALGITGNFTASSKIYDGDTSAVVLTRTLNSVIGVDVVSLTAGTATFDTKDVGTGKTVTLAGATLSGAQANNYSLTSVGTTTADITARALTVSATGINKAYDGNTTATVTLSDDKVSGDDVSESYTTATFNTKDVGTGKSVSVSGISIGGTDAGNYTFNTTAATTADITTRVMTVSATGVNKVYDGTTTATVTLSDDKVSGDDVSESYTTATFDTKDFGTGKTVSVSGISSSGADAGNYTFNTTATTTADITRATLTPSITAANKVYDGTDGATVTLYVLSGVIAPDAVYLTGTTATFSDKNVGTGKTVTASGLSLTGPGASNYMLGSTTATTTADITARTLAVTAAGVNKVYDGTTAAIVNLSDDRVAGDIFTDAYASASFVNRDVGTAKSVTVSGITISGTDAGNYTANTSTTATADISQRAISVTAVHDSKVYDGGVLSSAVPTFAPALMGGDTPKFRERFDTKNVLTGKTLLPTGTVTDSITLAASGNYAITFVNDTTGVITARALAVSATADSKNYDGTTAAVAHLSDDRVLGDVFTAAYTSATFADRNVGTGKTVNVSGIALSGTDAGNYTANPSTTALADISQRAITVTAVHDSKVYDGGVLSSGVPTFAPALVGGDTPKFRERFDTKNVLTGKTLLPTGTVTDSITLVASGNYAITFVNDTTGVITARALAVSATADSKNYDGTTAAVAHLSDDRVPGDVFTATYTTATFADRNVGTGKTVTVSGITLSGTDAGNYTANPSTTALADISQRAITVTAVHDSKVYDGGVLSSAVPTFAPALVGGDTPKFRERFDTKNVLTGKTLLPTGTVTDSITLAASANYAITFVNDTTGVITARALAVNATADSKNYDGTTAAVAHLSDDRVLGDVFTAAYTTAAFADRNVGTGKTVTVSGITISGTDAGNYTANSSTTATADITARALTVSAAGVNKVYDGNATATVTLSDDRVAGDVFTDSYTTATFNNKNLGTGKPVSVSGISISGTDAGNYTFNTTASTTANITARTLTVSATGVNKVYDGNTTATVTLSDNRVAGDIFIDSYTTATFANRNVGTGKAVSVSGISIGGTDAGNYTSNASASTMANITPAALTITALTNTKMYDGNASAAAIPTVSGVQPGDTVTGQTETYNNKNAGTGKTLSVAAYTVNDGNGGYNYAVTTVQNFTGVVNQRVLTITAMTNTKIYDTTVSATVLPTVVGIQTGDTVTGLAELYATPNVATGKTLSVSAYTVNDNNSGANYVVAIAPNYTGVVTLAGTTGNVTVSPGTQQYSDRVTFTATLTPDQIGGTAPATSVTFKVGTQVMGTAPLVAGGGVLTGTLANVALLEPVPLGTAPTGQMAPGAHTVTACFNGVNPNFAVNNATSSLTITQEDARATYNGLLFYSTGSVSSPSALITLSATIQDITALLGDPDGFAGDIRNARVRFVDRDNSDALLGTANLVPTLLNPADTKSGVVSTTTTVTVDNTGSKLLTVGIIVDYYYKRNCSLDDEIITVSQPIIGSITGGGYIVNQSSAGQYAGTLNAKSNFGFNVRNNKTGKNLQGNANLIFRRLETDGWHTYQIKTTATDSLAMTLTSPTTGVASFSSKGNLNDITNPLLPVGRGSGLQLNVSIHDNGEPGSSDTIGWTLWNGSTLVSSSNWNGTKTLEQLLGGGNLQAR